MRHLLVPAIVVAFVGAAAACRRSEGVGKPEPTRREAADGSRGDSAPRAQAAGESFAVRSWVFDVASSGFSIADLAMHGSLAEALGQDGRLAVNGGFFDPEGRPLGFAASGGRVLSRYSPTMSGGVFVVRDGRASVEATEDFDPQKAVDFAVQCRPRLVVQGQANVRRDDGQRAERTVLCVRDEGRSVAILLVTAEASAGGRGPSLFALSQYLAEAHRCDDALNLDGGPSTGAAFRVDGGGASALPPRGPLRYAIVVR